MAKALSVTKSANNTILVKFGSDLPALAKLKPGAEVPVEYLHSILHFHISNRNAKGTVDAKKAKQMQAYW